MNSALITDRLEAIAREAGEIILSADRLNVEKKAGHANYVTDVDKRVQEYLQKNVSGLVPGSRFIGEEGDEHTLTAAPTWIIDPVDGTTNLVHGYHLSAVSIALTENRLPVLGLVYNPYAGEMYRAEKGKGAYLNGERLHVAENAMEEALVAFGSTPYYPEKAKKSLEVAYEFLKECADIRRSGSAALDLCHLAAGRTDVFFELLLQPWDVAAGSLLVEEAGGVFRMPLSTEGVRFDAPQTVFAATKVCDGPALELFMRNL